MREKVSHIIHFNSFSFTYRERTFFEKPGLNVDVIDLRFKHYQGRLIDTFNRIIEQRR